MTKRAKAVRPPPIDSRPKNKLLACLPRADFQRLRPHIRTVPIAVKQIIHPRDEPIREVFFPNGGVASMTTVMQNGSMVEIATVGDEGVVGINAFFGGAHDERRNHDAGAGHERRGDVRRDFKRELDRRGALLRMRATLFAGPR